MWVDQEAPRRAYPQRGPSSSGYSTPTRRRCSTSRQYGKEGRLRHLPESVRDRDGLTPQVVATGMHLSPRHGRTVEGIRADGFVVDR